MLAKSLKTTVDTSEGLSKSKTLQVDIYNIARYRVNLLVYSISGIQTAPVDAGPCADPISGRRVNLPAVAIF
jgi:hypothetical protein